MGRRPSMSASQMGLWPALHPEAADQLSIQAPAVQLARPAPGDREAERERLWWAIQARRALDEAGRACGDDVKEG